MNKISKV